MNGKPLGRWSKVAIAVRCASYAQECIHLVQKDSDLAEYENRLDTVTNAAIQTAGSFAKNAGGAASIATSTIEPLKDLLQKFQSANSKNEKIKSIVLGATFSCLNAVIAARAFTLDQDDDGIHIVEMTLDTVYKIFDSLEENDILASIDKDLNEIARLDVENKNGDDSPFDLNLMPNISTFKISI